MLGTLGRYDQTTQALTWPATREARRMRQFRAQSEMEEEADPPIPIPFHLLFLFMIYRRYTTTEAGKDGGGAEKGRRGFISEQIDLQSP